MTDKNEYWEALFSGDKQEKEPIMTGEEALGVSDDLSIDSIIRDERAQQTYEAHEIVFNEPTKKMDSDVNKSQNKTEGYAEDFEINFDFETEYGETKKDINRGIKRRKDKRTGCLGGVLYFAFVLGLSVILACVGWMAATDVLGLGDPDSEVIITLDKGFEMQEVTDALYDNGLIQYKSLFNLYTKLSSADQKIKAGTYILNTNFDYRALVYGMTPGQGKKVEIDVTIPEGYNLSQIITLLAENQVCSEEDLWKAAEAYQFKDYDFIGLRTLGQKYRLEGYLFPDTYTFYISDAPERVFSKMIDNFESRWTEEYQLQAEALGYTMEEIVNVASIIEKEATSSDRNIIASVIYNRLENPSAGTAGFLGLESTIYYACAVEGVDFNVDVDSPYNTYLYQGLPEGPIANPGIAAIQAALYPEDTSYYYFALGKDGEHHFFTSYDGFLNFVNSSEYGE